MDIRISLDLKEHCIETEAKAVFRNMVSRYMESDAIDHEIEGKIELLREFIEKSDFKAMRSGDRKLAGGMDIKVILSRNAEGHIVMDYEH